MDKKGQAMTKDKNDMPEVIYADNSRLPAGGNWSVFPEIRKGSKQTKANMKPKYIRTKYVRADTRPVPSEVVEQVKHAFAIAIGDILYMANERNEIERLEEALRYYEQCGLDDNVARQALEKG